MLQLENGIKLYNKAAKAVKTHQVLKDKQVSHTASMVQISKPALDAYQSLYRIVCGVWEEGKSGLEAKGICGKLSNSTEGFLANSHALFNLATKNEKLSQTLKNYGYSREKLDDEKAKILKMERFFRQREAGLKAFKCAACARQKSIKELDAWARIFVLKFKS